MMTLVTADEKGRLCIKGTAKGRSTLLRRQKAAGG